MTQLKCRRCSIPLEKDSGRYLMALTFLADVDFELEDSTENVEGAMVELLDQIEQTPEEELINQVYQKLVFMICRRCKEELATDPFAPPPVPFSNSTH